MSFRLDRQMVLEDAGGAADGGGGRSADWAALGVLWAEVTPGSGGRVAGRDPAAVGSVPLRIVVRAAPPGSSMRPRPGQRLREGGRIYPILAVTEADAAGRYLTCFTREEVAG